MVVSQLKWMIYLTPRGQFIKDGLAGTKAYQASGRYIGQSRFSTEGVESMLGKDHSKGAARK
jgi:deoxyribodipyrimidine photolyase-like uncharacterized protein